MAEIPRAVEISENLRYPFVRVSVIFLGFLHLCVLAKLAIISMRFKQTVKESNTKNL